MSAKWIGWLPAFAMVVSAAEQRPIGMTMSWPLANGLYVVAHTYCTPPHAGASPFACLGQNGIEGRLAFHPDGHVLIARESRTWFGYSFTAERTSNDEKVRLSIGSASASAGTAGLQQLPLPRYDAGPFTLAPGDIVRIPLLVNHATGQTLIDELQIFTHEVQNVSELFTSESPRDFSFEDVYLRLKDCTLRVNSNQIEDSNVNATGRAVWYARKDMGSVALTFLPEATPGFRQVGVIRGRTLQFTVNSDQYEWRCAEPILPGDYAYNVYVHWDAFAYPGGLTYGSAGNGEQALKAIASVHAEFAK